MRLHTAYFRSLKRNAVVEQSQEWREWWAARAAEHGGACENPGCRL